MARRWRPAPAAAPSLAAAAAAAAALPAWHLLLQRNRGDGALSARAAPSMCYMDRDL